jgi:hypothetical protein
MRYRSSLAAKNRRDRKLLISGFVLGVVFLVAAYLEYTGGKRQVPQPINAANSAGTGADVERTVYGETPSTPASRSRSDTANSAGEVDSFLKVWCATFLSGNAAAHADLYAPRVNRYFRKRNVSRNDVRRETERLLARYPNFHKYEISGVQVEAIDEDKAVVSFRKDWEARGRGQFAGAERDRLTLSNGSGEWKITGEETTKVYWVRRR